MEKKYWIESIVDQIDTDIMKGVISCVGHGACIEVYGTRHELTERLIAIIEGLNKGVNK